MMSNHPIIDKVRRGKEILDSYGGDVPATMRDSKKCQFEGAVRSWASFRRRPTTSVPTEDSSPSSKPRCRTSPS